jgi:HlyD family secretion protein
MKAKLALIPTTTVRRADLTASLVAGGRVESSQNTEIECQIDRMSIGGGGNEFTNGGSSTILSLLPEGTTVKKGDVLCTLDSSAYEELLRQQKIALEKAQAEYRQAELTLEVAHLAVGEYEDGLLKQTLQDYRGQIALAKSDLQRGADRVEWAKRMLDKGYLSAGQLFNEEFKLASAKLKNAQLLTGLEVYERFSVPGTLRQLKSQVYSAESALAYQAKRVQLTQERLDKIQQQIEYCTIRAPHDGFLVYGDDDSRMVRIEPGMAVRRRQDLFMLPDLSRMEVLTLLHESVADEVRVGMVARVRVEGLPGRVLEGHVESIAQLPMQDRWTDIRYFMGHVRLDAIPKGLLPGMSAEVEIRTALRQDVLTIPPDALAVERGRDVCYVRNPDGLERREVKLGKSTRDLLEVVAGLEEGEEVVNDPMRHGASSVVVAETLLPEAEPLLEVASTN